MKFTSQIIKAAHALARQAKAQGFDYRASFGLALRHLIKFGVPMSNLTGTEKQLAWADDIIAKLREACDSIVAAGKDDNARNLLAKGADAYMAEWGAKANNRADWYIAKFGGITKMTAAEVEIGYNIRGAIVAHAKAIMAAA